MQASTFTPDKVLQIMGPAGTVSGSAVLPARRQHRSDDPRRDLQRLRHADSTLTVPSFDGTFSVAKLTVQLNSPPPTSALSAVLIAPDGNTGHLFGVGGTGWSNFINTVFRRRGQVAISAGTAPFTGTFKPSDPEWARTA